MKVGDLVKSIVSSPDDCRSGLVVKYWEDHSGFEAEEHAMILWDHGEVCYSPACEVEVISERR